MSTNSPPAPPQDRDAQLLAIGKQCSHRSCLLVDFLPFKCQHCQDSFCQEHWKASSHNCTKYDEYSHNRVAPNCPLCNIPVAFAPGQDPNIRMEEHFAKDCSVMTGNSGKTKSANVCASGYCKKVLFAPIRCDRCGDQFCPTHRFPSDHNCSGPVATPSRPAAQSNLLDKFETKNLNKAANAGAATLGAIKKSIATTSTRLQANTHQISNPTAVSSKPSSSTVPHPFSKADRRAKAERNSRRKAMQERAKKGLLSEEEKAALAADDSSAKKGDCTVM